MRALRLFCISFSMLLLVISLGCGEEKSGSADKAQMPEVDPQKLAGKWLRPDGGYILELSDIAGNGSLRAAYFNPNPINVGESKWRWEGTKLQVFVKFDDVNYPGSYYYLNYTPELDRLVGAYYQAVQDQTYNVEFVRHE